jgi:methyltransferase
MVTWRGFYFGYLAFLALERLGELVLSRRNARRMFARGAIELGQGHFPTMALFHSLFLVACVVEPLLRAQPPAPALAATALAGTLAAEALRVWAIASLGERWNVRIIVLPGLAPVTSGPYRFVRHPNYVAVALELLCVPLMYGAWLTAIVFTVGNGLVLLVRIRAEEAALGKGYAEHFAATPRFVPGGKS